MRHDCSWHGNRGDVSQNHYVIGIITYVQIITKVQIITSAQSLRRCKSFRQRKSWRRRESFRQRRTNSRISNSPQLFVGHDFPGREVSQPRETNIMVVDEYSNRYQIRFAQVIDEAWHVAVVTRVDAEHLAVLKTSSRIFLPEISK